MPEQSVDQRLFGGGADPASDDELDFGQAFAKARKSGVKTFRWRGREFTTELKEEAEPQPKAAPVAAEFQAIGSSLGNVFDKVTSVATLAEGSKNLPESIKRVGDIFQDELVRGAELFGSSVDPRADAFRHVMGSRRAALEVGHIQAIAAGIGHELNNVRSFLEGRGRDVGSNRPDVSASEVFENLRQDLFNNMLGIISAVINPGELNEFEQTQLIAQASVGSDLRRKA